MDTLGLCVEEHADGVAIEPSDWEKLIFAARAALAKARGETP